MATRKAGKKTQTRAKATQEDTPEQSERIQKIGGSSSQIVMDAAALLDEEIASGIVAAKRAQQRLRKDRRIDTSDFADALQKFQGDAHQVVGMLNDQFARLRSEEASDLVSRFTSSTNNLIDLVVELFNTGAEIADQLAQSNLQKKEDQGDAHTSR
jgi:hypothetical protein